MYYTQGQPWCLRGTVLWPLGPGESAPDSGEGVGVRVGAVVETGMGWPGKSSTPIYMWGGGSCRTAFSRGFFTETPGPGSEAQDSSLSFPKQPIGPSRGRPRPFPGQPVLNDCSVWKYKGLATLAQLGTTQKGRSSSRAWPALQPSSLSAHLCLFLVLPFPCAPYPSFPFLFWSSEHSK